MVSGPQIAGIIAEFEEKLNLKDLDDSTDVKRHEQTESWQKSFFEDVCSLVSVM